jgi:nucleoside-diphosphate-sugar epimerase
MLVTGGAGFIGFRFASLAMQAGWNVRILDNLSTGNTKHISLLQQKGAEVAIGDIRNAELVSSCIAGCDTVVHLAAQGSVPVSIQQPEETMDINVRGTQQILDACFTYNVRKMVMASSAAVYGNIDKLPLHEEDGGHILSPYAASKWKNEQQILQARSQGLNCAALRFFNVYGPGQSAQAAYSAVIPKFCEMMMKGTPPMILGDGEQTRDFVHVDDVCSAIFSLIEAGKHEREHHVYNVGSQTQFSLIDLVSVLNEKLGVLIEDYVPIQPQFGQERMGDVKHSFASIERLSKATGWKPHISFSDGIEDLLRGQGNQIV